LLVEDDESVRELFYDKLKQNKKYIFLIKQAGDGLLAVQLARTWKPNIVITDIRMPGLNGIDASRRTKALLPTCKIIVWSGYVDQQRFDELRRLGIDGYLAKQDALKIVEKAIEIVINGGQYFSALTADHLDDDLPLRPIVEGPSPDELTPRQLEVLVLVAQGYTSQEIARQLKITPNTVKYYRKKFVEILQLHSNGEVTRYAIRHHLIDP
jgi:DNA-binding NarL/FixJ family response regulator